jgi:hypothetical protein
MSAAVTEQVGTAVSVGFVAVLVVLLVPQAASATIEARVTLNRAFAAILRPE